jgi:starvation-inducible DNA-binding protein
MEHIDAAKVVLADSYKFLIKAQNYHWNVVGPNFPQYHEFLGNIYEEVQGSIDTIAEHIRAMGSFTPASFGRFNELSYIADETEILTADDMLDRLYKDNLLVISNLEKAYELAEAVHEHGWSNFLAERLTAHKKHGWMLRSTIKNT